MLSVGHEQCESSDAAEREATGGGILELASDVSVAISVEEFLTAGVLGEHLDVNLRKWSSSLAVDSELAVLLIHLNLEVRLVESLEDLDVLGVYLDDEILLLELGRHFDSLDFLGHRLGQSQERFDVAELLGLILDEGLSGEQDLCVNLVIFDGQLPNIALLDDQVSLAVHGDLMDDLSIVLGFDAGVLDISLVLIVQVEVACVHLVDLRKLLIDLFEHLAQVLNWIVSILSNDTLDFHKVWCSLVEFEIGCHVVEEHSLVILKMGLVDLGVDLLGCLNSILQLQIVSQLKLELWSRLYLVKAHVHEVLVGGSEIDVQDLLECSLLGGLLLTNREGSLVHHWVVFEVVMSHLVELLGAQIEKLALDGGVEVVHGFIAQLLPLNLFGNSVEEVSDQLHVLFSEGDKLFVLDELWESTDSGGDDMFGIHASRGKCHDDVSEEYLVFDDEPSDVLEVELEMMIQMEIHVCFDHLQDVLLLQLLGFGSHHDLLERVCLLNDALLADLERNHLRFSGDDVVLRNTGGTVLEFAYLREVEVHFEPLGGESVQVNDFAINGLALENWKTAVRDLEHRCDVLSLARNVGDDHFANVDFVEDQS